MLTIQSFTFNPVQENTYILYNEYNNAIVIDPGCYFNVEEKRLQSFIEQKGLTIQYLINTHCHFDHVFGNKFIVDKYNVKPCIHLQEEIMFNNASIAAEKWGLSYTPYTGEVQFIADKEIIKLDDDKLQVILTPGHSPGHICLYSEAQQFLIAGDVLFYESVGRTDLPMCNHEDLMKSIKERIFTLPNATVVYPGHGHTTTIEHEKLYNPFVQ